MIVKPTPAEDLRQRVTLLKRNPKLKNELGETLPQRLPIGRVWAKVTPTSAEELKQNAQSTLSVTHEVRIRYQAELTSADAINFRGRVLEILSLIDIEEQHVELQLLCNEQRS